MKVIIPITITDAIFYSSTVSETDYAVWSSITNYTAGQRCIRLGTHSIYECLVPNSNAIPENNVEEVTPTTPKWLFVSKTNKWCQFDQLISVPTRAASPYTFVLKPTGFVSGISLFGLVGTSCHISATSGDSTIFDQTYNLDGTIITSWWEWLFEPYAQKRSVIVYDFPPYLNPTITITISGSGTVEVGDCQIGLVKSIGDVRKGSGFKIYDYSTVSTNTFGVPKFLKRKATRGLSLLIIVENNRLEYFEKIMTELLSSPCVWIPSTSDKYRFLGTMGWYTELEVVIAYLNHSTYSLTIKGNI